MRVSSATAVLQMLGLSLLAEEKQELLATADPPADGAASGPTKSHTKAESDNDSQGKKKKPKPNKKRRKPKPKQQMQQKMENP